MSIARYAFAALAALVLVIPASAYESPAEYMNIRKAKFNNYKASGRFKADVLKAFLDTPREFFLPVTKRSLAYEENPVPIGYGQTITNPWFVTYMTDLLQVKSTDRVLEIGTGSGYQGAVLWQLTKQVYSIEIVEPLSVEARKRWLDLGYGIMGKAGDGYFGWEEHGPFDKIVVTCAADHVPVHLMRQLKPGGILLIPVGNPFNRQTLQLIRKKMDGGVVTERLGTVQFVPFTGKMLDKYKK